MPKPLSEVVEAGWAEALAPVADRIAAMGDFLRAEVAAGRRTCRPVRTCCARSTQPFAEVRVLIVGQDPYPTPGPSGRAVLLGGARRPAAAAQPGEHLPRAAHDLGLPGPSNGDLTAVDRAGRAAAQPGADRRAGPARRPPRQGLGSGHRAGDPRAVGARQAAGGDPVGTGRADAAAAARRRARRSSRRTPSRCRPIAASSAPGRSAGATRCSSSAGAERRGLAADLSRFPSAERYPVRCRPRRMHTDAPKAEGRRCRCRSLGSIATARAGAAAVCLADREKTVADQSDRPGCPRAQPQGRSPRPAARRDDRLHRAVRLRQVEPRLRHDLRRGPAPLRGVAVRLRPAVPRPDGQARRRLHRGTVAGGVDRPEVDVAQPALDGRHDHRGL